MTGDGPALLRTILERPDDDAPRLVYADWLEENGQQNRAEFIRLQLWSAAMRHNHQARGYGGGDGLCAACQINRQEQALARRIDWGLTGLNWQISVRDLQYHDYPYVRLYRGFIVEVGCHWPTWEECGDALYAANPVAKVNLVTWPGKAMTILGNPHWLNGWTVSWDNGSCLMPDRERFVRRCLDDRWPGINFVLPWEDEF